MAPLCDLVHPLLPSGEAHSSGQALAERVIVENDLQNDRDDGTFAGSSEIKREGRTPLSSRKILRSTGRRSG